jgi:integrase
VIRKRRDGLQVQVFAGQTRPPCARPSRLRPGSWRRSAPASTKDALACGTTLAADAYVFSHVPDGSKPIDPDGISHRFLRLARRLGVNCRLHDLRHFMVTQLVAGGWTGAPSPAGLGTPMVT